MHLSIPKYRLAYSVFSLMSIYPVLKYSIYLGRDFSRVVVRRLAGVAGYHPGGRGGPAHVGCLRLFPGRLRSGGHEGRL